MHVLDTPVPMRVDAMARAEPGRLVAAKTGRKILTLFGTRPEVIKLAPVLQQLESADGQFQTVNVTSAQHTDLLYPLIRWFGIRLDYDLQSMRQDQTPSQVCRRIQAALDPILAAERPDLILVQGDTATALAGALAGCQRGIAVGHVEAGLRSGNRYSPYPEEINRQRITQLATYHFAATPGNRDTLLVEGVPAERIFLTGNPVVDALETILQQNAAVFAARDCLPPIAGRRLLVMTTHRRESFGKPLRQNLEVLRRFVDCHADVGLVFPVHPNPAVRRAAASVLAGHPRIELLDPLPYVDFIDLLRSAWLIVSDSGGIQEEAVTLGKPLLILRENTERPEAVASGRARLVGGRPERLAALLEAAYWDSAWTVTRNRMSNPFGDGKAGLRIAQAIAERFASECARMKAK